MKIITNNKIYIQKKDLELIFKLISTEEVPNNIVEKYKQNTNIKDLDFIFFEDKEEIDFLNSFWFVINLYDIIDFNDKELHEYNYSDLEKFRSMRVEYDKHKFLPEKKIYKDFMEILLDQVEYKCYIPRKDEAKNYPLDFQLLYNKVLDVIELEYFKNGQSNLEFPEEVLKPVRYSKKQLQQIYNEVLGENLTFEDLKPFEKQLYLIFSKIDYTPEILDIIRKMMIINKYNTLDFINEDLLNVILRIEGKKSKFEETSSLLIDYLYAIGYNRFENFDSKIVLEKDLRIIRNFIDYISYANLEDEYIDKLANYNCILAEIIRTLNKCDYSSNNSIFCVRDIFVRDIFSKMVVYVYFNPNVINYNYDFLTYVYDYVLNNYLDIINLTGYKLKIFGIHDEHFVDNFNRASNVLLYLYHQKYNSNADKENHRLIKSKKEQS